MGTVVSIAIHTEEENAATMYKAALKRFSRKGEIIRATCERWVSRKLVKKIPKAAWTSGNRIFLDDEIPTQGEDFYNLIDKIPDSSSVIQTRCSYRLFSEREIAVSLYLYGKHYESGFDVRDNGYIRVSVLMNDVDRPFKQLFADPYYKSLSKEELYENETIRELAQQVTQDWARLFLDICGIESDQEPLVQHAGMYLENGWPFPACCSMLYHRDKLEFAKDFLRIYWSHNLERQYMPLMLSKEFDLEKVIASPLANSDRKDKANYYQHFDFSDGKLIDFLDSLELKKVRKLAQFSEAEIAAALSLAGVFVKDHELEYSTFYLDLDKKGAVLLSTPTTSIWKVYEYIYQFV